MRLLIPSDAALGTATLLWGLAEAGAADKEDLRIQAP